MLQRNQVAIYTTVVLALSGIIAATAHATGNVNLSFLSVFTPSLLALVIVWLVEGSKGAKSLFIDRLFKPFGGVWLWVAFLVFPLAAILAVTLHSLFGGPALELRTTQLWPQVLVILMISLGEEFGWRGYLLPKLQEKHSPLKASLILGLIWGAWHFPAFLIGTGVPQEMPFLVFLLWVLIATQVMTWVYNRTGSVLPAILMHTMANVSFNYLPLLPEFVGQLTTFLLFLAVLTGGIACLKPFFPKVPPQTLGH